MDFELRAWYVFGSALLLFMGLTLALDAESRARSAAQWPGSRPGGADPEALVRQFVKAYRAGGLALCAGGVYGLVSVFWFPANLLRAAPPSLGTAGRLAAGAVLLAAGGVMAAVKAGAALRPAPRFAFLEKDVAATPSRGPAQRLAVLCGWLVVASFVSFGALLVSRSQGGSHAREYDR